MTLCIAKYWNVQAGELKWKSADLFHGDDDDDDDDVKYSKAT
jgi:hypothetical protein